MNQNALNKRVSPCLYSYCILYLYISSLYLYLLKLFFVVVFGGLNLLLLASILYTNSRYRFLYRPLLSYDHTSLSSRDRFSSVTPSPPLDGIVFLLSVSASSTRVWYIREKKRAEMRHTRAQLRIKLRSYMGITNPK